MYSLKNAGKPVRGRAARSSGVDGEDPSGRADAHRDHLKMEPLCVRVPEAMRLTGIGRSKLYELIASGDVQIVKVGTATLVTMASLRRLVERGSA